MRNRNTFHLWCVALALFVTLTTIPLGLWTLRESVLTTTQTILTQEATLLEVLGKNMLKTQVPHTALPENTDFRFTILDLTGKVLLDSHFQELSPHEDRPEIQAALLGKVGHATRFSKTSKADLYYMAFPIRDENHIIGVSRIAIPLYKIRAIENQILREKAPFFLIFFAVFWGLVAGAYLVNRAYLKHMAQALRERNADHLSTHIPDKNNAEIQDVCIALTEKLASELTQKELALEEKKAILDHLTERVLLVGPQDEIVHLNPAAKQLFSLSNDKGLYVSHACRNSVFLETVRLTLQNQVVNHKRILFHTPTGPLSLMVTGVPILLNKQVHALLLLATPSYTWLPTYTKLIQLWIEKQDKLSTASLYLQTMNETHSKLCKSAILPKGFSATEVLQAARQLDIPITGDIAQESPTKAYLMDLSLVMTILITVRLCYDQPTIHMTPLESELTLVCQWDTHAQTENKQPLDPGLYKFIEALIVYFQATIQDIPSGFQITFKER